MKILVNSFFGLLVAAAIVAPLSSRAGSGLQVTVGTASSSGNCYPFGCNETGSDRGVAWDYQQIYAASAFSRPIEIQSLTFFVFSGSPAPLSGDYVVSLATTRAPLATTYPVAPLAGETQVFSGALPAQSGQSYRIAIAPFVYDPSAGNLVLDVAVSNQAAIDSNSATTYFVSDADQTASTRAYLFSGGAYLPSGPTDVGQALQTRFDGIAAPEPGSWALMVAGLALSGWAARREALRRSA